VVKAPVKKAVAKKPAAKKVVAKKVVAKKAVVKKSVKPAPKKAVQKPIAKKVAPVKAVKVAVKPAAKPQPKPVAKPIVKPIAKPAPQPKPAAPAPAPKPAPAPVVKKEEVKPPAPAVAPIKKEEKKSMIEVRYSDKDLNDFESLIKDKLKVAKSDLDELKQSLSHEGDNSTDDTAPTFKMMEDGSETMNREELSQLAARQEKFIVNLENALLRIKNKTYGICRVTGKLIPKERLRLVPHATLSIEAKNMQ
jgi:RNA polymerase-binding transcription factor DksA